MAIYFTGKSILKIDSFATVLQWVNSCHKKAPYLYEYMYENIFMYENFHSPRCRQLRSLFLGNIMKLTTWKSTLVTFKGSDEVRPQYIQSMKKNFLVLTFITYRWTGLQLSLFINI